MFRLGFTGLFKYIIKFLGNDLVQHVLGLSFTWFSWILKDKIGFLTQLCEIQ